MIMTLVEREVNFCAKCLAVSGKGIKAKQMALKVADAERRHTVTRASPVTSVNGLQNPRWA